MDRLRTNRMVFESDRRRYQAKRSNLTTLVRVGGPSALEVSFLDAFKYSFQSHQTDLRSKKGPKSNLVSRWPPRMPKWPGGIGRRRWL